VPGDDFCYLTTTGRRTGRRHRIEIWYAKHGDTLFLLAGGARSADWVQNLIADPAVDVELNGVDHRATGRLIDDAAEGELARSMVFDKYAPRYSDDLTEWRHRALPIAIDLTS